MYRELLAVQEYAMYNAQFVDRCILTYTIHRCDLSIVRFLFDRIAIKYGVDFICNCNSLVKERAKDN